MDKSIINNVERFETMASGSNTLRLRRVTKKDSITVVLLGQHGEAEVEFKENLIMGTIDAGFYHWWEVLPGDDDLRASADKIRELITMP